MLNKIKKLNQKVNKEALGVLNGITLKNIDFLTLDEDSFKSNIITKDGIVYLTLTDKQHLIAPNGISVNEYIIIDSALGAGVWLLLYKDGQIYNYYASHGVSSIVKVNNSEVILGLIGTKEWSNMLKQLVAYDLQCLKAGSFNLAISTNNSNELFVLGNEWGTIVVNKDLTTVVS